MPRRRAAGATASVKISASPPAGPDKDEIAALQPSEGEGAGLRQELGDPLGAPGLGERRRVQASQMSHIARRDK